MPWKESCKTMLREEFVKRVLSHEKSKSALCKEYGISRPTGDKWIKRYLEDGSLGDKSRAPFKTANKTHEDIEKRVIELRNQYPAMGALKIQRIMKNRGYEHIPSSSTINAILKRNGLITKEASEAATPYKRFVKQHPNDLWQADFKGHFLINSNERIHPLNIIDDYSRFNICSVPLLSETFAAVKPTLIKVFTEYGLPVALLCDNGNPWGTVQSTGFTKFEVWLMEHNVLTIHGRFKHPQTQGKDERFNGTLTREFLKYNEFENLEDAVEKFEKFRDFYNNERPHHALNLDTPSEYYIRSNRQYTEKIYEWEYEREYKIHKVKNSGYITYKGQGYFLSEAFGGKTIAIKETDKSELINIYYRNFIIGQIDIYRRVFTFKKAYLINGDPRKNNL